MVNGGDPRQLIIVMDGGTKISPPDSDKMKGGGGGGGGGSGTNSGTY